MFLNKVVIYFDFINKKGDNQKEKFVLNMFFILRFIYFKTVLEIVFQHLFAEQSNLMLTAKEISFAIKYKFLNIKRSVIE